jgi:hypothetical protein
LAAPSRRRARTVAAPPAELNYLLRVPGIEEGLGSLEARVRHAVTLAHRYRLMRYELFGDRHWIGRPEAPWWCPDHDLAARSPFDGYAKGGVPAYALTLTDHQSGNHRAGELTVVAAPSEPPRCHDFDIIDGELRMHDEVDPATHLAVPGRVDGTRRRADKPVSRRIHAVLRRTSIRCGDRQRSLHIGRVVAPWSIGCSGPWTDIHGLGRIFVASCVVEVAFGTPDGAGCSRTGPDGTRR